MFTWTHLGSKKREIMFQPLLDNLTSISSCHYAKFFQHLLISSCPYDLHRGLEVKLEKVKILIYEY